MKLINSEFGKFVPVRYNNRIYYGGFQESLKDRGVKKFYRDRSCVITAFTNTYLYMYRKNENFTLDQYNDYQYWLYKIIRPKLWGVPTAEVLNLKLNRLRRAYPISLRSNILTDSFIKRKTIDEKVDFITRAISRDLPVIFFNWLSPKVNIMTHHGVTITEIEKAGDEYMLTISSWGKKYKISLNKFSNQLRTYSGFIYFEK